MSFYSEGMLFFFFFSSLFHREFVPHVILPNTYGHLTGILRNTNEVTKVDHCFYLCFFTSKVMRICRLLEQSRDSDDDDDNDYSMFAESMRPLMVEYLQCMDDIEICKEHLEEIDGGYRDIVDKQEL